MGLLFFCFLFSEGFYQTKKSFEKTKNTKEKQRNQQTLGKTENKVFKGFRFTLGYVFFVFWFSRRFLQNQKTFRENHIQQKTKENQKHIRNN